MRKQFTETFHTDLVCGERREFNSHQHRQTFKKLHFKKCDKCRNASTLHFGETFTAFSNKALSYMEKQERIELQNQIVKKFN